MNDKLRILFNPAFLLALLLLLLNDHLLKATYPSWLTGKLSDFAGLFVLAAFILAIAGRYLKTNRSLLVLHTLIGLSFIIWKIAPVELLFIEINKLLTIPLPSRVKDPSDLIALSILPISFIYLKRFIGKLTDPVPLPALKKAATAGVLAITCFAIIATSPGKSYDIKPNIVVETHKTQARLIELFKQTLNENDIEIQYSRDLNDSTFIYRVKFSKESDDGKWKDRERVFVSYITLIHSDFHNTITIKSIYGWVTYDLPGDNDLERFYDELIIKPFLDKLK